MADAYLALLSQSLDGGGLGFNGSLLTLDSVRDRVGEQLAWTQLPTWRLVLMALLMGSGAATNAWLLYTGLRQKKLRKSTFHVLLRNHTLTNLFLSVFLYPVLLYRMKKGLPANKAEQELCSCSSFLMLWFVSIGFCTNVLTALNRAASCHPTWAPGVKIRGTKFTYGALIVVWVCACALVACTALLEEESWKGLFACSLLEDILNNYFSGKDPLMVHPMKNIMIVELGVSVGLSVILTSICYGLIAKFLLKRKGPTQESSQRRKDKARALVIIVVDNILFLICWIPIIAVLIADPVEAAKKPIYMTLPMMESFINPVFYLITMPAYRPQWIAKIGQTVTPIKVKTVEEGQTNDNTMTGTGIGTMKEDNDFKTVID